MNFERTEHTPDSWVIIKVSGVEEKDFFKVLAGWSGGYTTGDSWRMNSGIDKIEEDDEYYTFIGASGSRYKCHKEGQTMRMSMAGTWTQLSEKYPDNVSLVDVSEIVLPD